MAKVATGVKLTVGDYWERARDTAAEIGVLLLQAAGLEPETVLADRDTVAAVLAATNDEATFTNYTRQVLPTVAVIRDNTVNSVTLTLAGDPPFSLLWADAGGAVNNVLGRIVYYFDPAPGSSTDAQKIHLVSAAVDAVTDGSTIMITIDVGGVATAADAF